MIIAPSIAAEISGKVPGVTAAVDPALDREGARGTFELRFRDLSALTAKDYFRIVHAATGPFDEDGIVWYDDLLEITEITYEEAIEAMTSVFVAGCGSALFAARVSASWRSNGMTGLGLPAVALFRVGP